MTWLVVRNPSAGRGGEIAERLEAALDGAGVLHRTVVPDDPSEVDAVVAEAVAEGLSSFAAVGGDGGGAASNRPQPLTRSMLNVSEISVLIGGGQPHCPRRCPRDCAASTESQSRQQDTPTLT